MARDENNDGLPGQLEDIARRLETISLSQETLQRQQVGFAAQQTTFVGQLGDMQRQMTDMTRSVTDVHSDMRGTGQTGGIVARLLLLERDHKDHEDRIAEAEKRRSDEVAEAQKTRTATMLWMIGMFFSIAFAGASLLVAILKHP